MARKKRKVEKKEEEYEWTPPEFDERAFLEKDIRDTRTLAVTVLSCVVFAVIAYFVGTAVHFALGFVVLLVGLYSLRFIYQLAKVDRENIETKSKVSNYLLFFFLFMGLWILFMNPPFSDHTKPHIETVEIWVYDNDTHEWTLMTPENRGTLIHAGKVVNITAVITDNGDLKNTQINVHPSGEMGSFVNMTYVSNDTFQYISAYDTGEITYYFVILAEDKAGNTNQYEGSFYVN